MMKSIDVKIAQSEAEWRRSREENMGVRESMNRLFRAFTRSAGKRVRCLLRNICLSMNKTGFKPSYDGDRENIVVSITSTGDRIRNILPTLRSLTVQTRKPDLIILWLGKGTAYPKRILSRIREMGIHIKYREDLGPNTKYYHAFREYHKDVVITVDDDILYHRDMIKELVGTYLRYPEAVAARRVHKIRFQRNRRPARYKDWIWEYRDSAGPSHELFATGTGGILYPPTVMALMCWEDKDFLKVCPKADDIWLKFLELKSGIRVCAVHDAGFDQDAQNLRAKKTGLAAENVAKGRNDEWLRSCADHFGMGADLCERIFAEG